MIRRKSKEGIQYLTLNSQHMLESQREQLRVINGGKEKQNEP